jgi:hypothetical protein
MKGDADGSGLRCNTIVNEVGNGRRKRITDRSKRLDERGRLRRNYVVFLHYECRSQRGMPCVRPSSKQIEIVVRPVSGSWKFQKAIIRLIIKFARDLSSPQHPRSPKNPEVISSIVESLYAAVKLSLVENLQNVTQIQVIWRARHGFPFVIQS